MTQCLQLNCLSNFHEIGYSSSAQKVDRYEFGEIRCCDSYTLFKEVNEFLPAAYVFRDQILMTFSLKDLYIMLYGCEFRENRCREKHILLTAQMKICHYFLHFSPDLDQIR